MSTEFDEALTNMLRVIERQLLEVIGILAIADSPEDVTYAKQRLVGIVHGLRIVTDGIDQAPMTLGELEQKQFDRARSVDEEFQNHLEHNKNRDH